MPLHEPNARKSTSIQRCVFGVVQDQTALKFVWPGRDGVILARATADSKVEKIRNIKDLQQLKKQHSKRSLDESLLNSTMSSNSAPAPKHQKQL